MRGDGRAWARADRHRTLPTQHPWIGQAACAGHDPAYWFVAEQTTYAYARAICANCPVRPDCLDWALRSGEVQGFWGGKSPKERREIRCGRRAAS